MKRLGADVLDNQAHADERYGTELLAKNAKLLSGRDRVLMELYLSKGTSFYQMAVLSGIAETTVSRRIRRAIGRFFEGKYNICLVNRAKFSAMELRIARDYFLRGLSIKTLAGRYGIS